MAVNWKVSTDVAPADLQKTLEEFTNERWRVMSVNITPDQKHEGDVGWTTHSPGTFTVVAYRMSRESRQRDDVE